MRDDALLTAGSNRGVVPLIDPLRGRYCHSMDQHAKRDLMQDLLLPTLLFAALGGMAWAVRGSSGAGGMNAHVAPGLIWGTAWWFMARERGGTQPRRYTSGWILLAVTAGFAIAGERGWMQWHHFYDGHLSTNYAKQEYVPISTAYGHFWYFIAGFAWAGLPACFLAWCASQRPLRLWEWTLRVACGFGGAYLAWRLFAAYPEHFLPLYGSIKEKYLDFHSNPSLIKLYRDCGSATRHVGFCLGFLAFEVARKDWKNVILITVVGLINGAGWAALENWKWAARVWPDAQFNFGTCWEVSGGISIGIGFGVAYFLVNGKMSRDAIAAERVRLASAGPNRLWLLAALLLGLIGWTMFWPPAVDLRIVSASAPSASLVHVCGIVCLLFAAIFCGAAFVYSRSTLNASAQRERIEGWIEIALILALGWFVRMQLANVYSDEPADGSLGGWFGPATVYYAILLVYCALGGLKRTADWLATYLSLGVILLWCLSVGMENAWHASVFFGIVGFAFGIAYHFVTRNESEIKNAPFPRIAQPTQDPNLECWGAYLGLVYGLGLTLRKGMKGATNIYIGNENYWDAIFWNWIAFAMLLGMLAGMVWILWKRKPNGFAGDVFPRAYRIFWLILLAENALAVAVTGPIVGTSAAWIPFVFDLLYLILFFQSAAIAYHCQYVKMRNASGAAQ